MRERFAIYIKWRYINTLPFLSFHCTKHKKAIFKNTKIISTHAIFGHISERSSWQDRWPSAPAPSCASNKDTTSNVNLNTDWYTHKYTVDIDDVRTLNIVTDDTLSTTADLQICEPCSIQMWDRGPGLTSFLFCFPLFYWCPSMGLAMDSDAGKMPRRTKDCF